MTELANALARYLNHARTRIAARIGGVPGESHPPSRVRPMTQAVQSWLEECEGDPSWDGLVKTCANIFSKEGHSKGEWGWQNALEHWLRREGTYLSLLEGVHHNPVEVAAAFAKAVRTTDERVVFLALLGGVGFTKNHMDFGDFEILRPNAEMLNAVLGISVNRIFYPRAVTSTERLTDHWYLRCETRERRRKVGFITLGDTFSGPVQPKYTDFHPRVEAALKRLTLWDCQGDVPEGWVGFSVPFVIEAHDNPLQAPPTAPPINRLYYEPVFDNYGEEIGEAPEYWYRLKAEETERFELFVRKIVGQLESILSLGEPWQFVDYSLNYLVKAFFSYGLEQLLWHIVALEALLGEKGAGVTDRLTRRIAAIYSEDREMNEAAGETFRELYALRNSLVHGRPFSAQADTGHLRSGRMLARTVATRMLTLLGRLADEVKAGRLTGIPTREEVLGVLDLEEPSRARLAELLRAFPKVNG